MKADNDLKKKVENRLKYYDKIINEIERKHDTTFPAFTEKLKNNATMELEDGWMDLKAAITMKEEVEKLEKDLMKANDKINKYERKYGMNFTKFEDKRLDPETDLDQYGDYLDWYFWHKVFKKSKKEISKLI